MISNFPNLKTHFNHRHDAFGLIKFILEVYPSTHVLNVLESKVEAFEIHELSRGIIFPSKGTMTLILRFVS